MRLIANNDTSSNLCCSHYENTRVHRDVFVFFLKKCEHSFFTIQLHSLKIQVQFFLLSKLGQSTETDITPRLTFPNNLTARSDFHLTHITIFTNHFAATCQILTQKLGTYNSFISIICHYLHSYQFQKKGITRVRSPISSVSDDPNRLHVCRWTIGSFSFHPLLNLEKII